MFIAVNLHIVPFRSFLQALRTAVRKYALAYPQLLLLSKVHAVTLQKPVTILFFREQQLSCMYSGFFFSAINSTGGEETSDHRDRWTEVMPRGLFLDVQMIHQRNQ